MSIFCEKNDAASRIRLEVVVDIATAAELKAALLDLVRPGVALQIAVDRVTYFDVTAMQLLWAARQEAERLGGTCTWAGAVPSAIRSQLQAAGVGDLLPCPQTALHGEAR